MAKLEGVAQDAFGDEAGWATYNYLSYAGPNLDSAHMDFKAGAVNAAKKLVQKQFDQVKQKAQQEGQKALEQKGKDLLKNLFGH